MVAGFALAYPLTLATQPSPTMQKENIYHFRDVQTAKEGAK
jgi:hypothetical protein